MKLTLHILSLTIACSVFADSVDLNKITTEEVRKKIGIESLNDQQKIALQEWLAEWTKTVIDQSKTYHPSQKIADWVSKLPKYATPKLESNEVIEELKEANKKISKVRNDGEIIELEDGSIWKISPFDRYKTKGWQRGDMVSNKKISNIKRPYQVNNTTQKQTAEAELKTAPSPTGKREEESSKYFEGSAMIVEVHLKGRTISLQNNTNWVISPGDQPRVKNWKVNDRIKVKRNDNSIYKYNIENLDSGEKVLANTTESTLSSY